MEEKYPRLVGINYESLVDGIGVRSAIFLAGCSHHCPGCQNPSTWSPSAGQVVDDALMDEIAGEIQKRPFVRGITLTGGDPFFAPCKTLEFLKSLLYRIGDLPCAEDIWIYTGYTWEELTSMKETNPFVEQLLNLCDVLVDGPFIEALKDRRLTFCGSSNQRIIDVAETKKMGTLVCRRYNHGLHAES